MRRRQRLLVVAAAAAVCLAMVNAEDVTATGWCCPARKDGGGGCPGPYAELFQPMFVNTTVTLIWKTRDLTCPPSSSPTLVRTHYDEFDNETIASTYTLLDPYDENHEMSLIYSLGGIADKETRDYCVERDGEEYKISVCQPDPAKICGSGICIPKCCGEGEVLYEEDHFCSYGENESMPLHFRSFHGEPLPAPANVVTIGDRVPECEAEGAIISTITEENFNLLVNGKLLDSKSQTTHDFDEYCIENYHYENGEVHQKAFVCTTPESTAITIKYELMKVGYIISDVFLIITIVFHIVIPGLRDAQGLILVSHMASMFVALTVLFILATADLFHSVCVFFGFVFQYSFLAMFFWLNVMCFDIWRVIRATAKGIPLLGILSNDAKKFQLYCLYCWGFPLVITIVTAITHNLPEELAEGIIRPGFGKTTCWLPGDLEHLIYCYAYVAALFILDLLFIGHTVYMLYQAGNAFTCFARQVTVTAFNRKHLEAFWQRFGVFILMVFCWTAELLSWKIHPQEIWIVTDVINSLQGLVIFLIFISSKKRRGMVKELLEKATSRLPFMSSQARPSITTQWTVNSPSTSISGPSGSSSTQNDSNSKTDARDSS